MASGFLKYAIIMLFPFILSACVSKPVYNPDVKFADRTTLAFTGKGAAAGIMMDAYMGGAGVAIGIAIDEGIAKDIATNISSRPSGFDMLDLVKKELVLKSKLHDKAKNQKQISATKITVETYGFRTVSGDGDKVSAWLKIRFSNESGDSILIYPDEFTGTETINFNDAKKNPKLAFNILKAATDMVLEKWVSSLK